MGRRSKMYLRQAEQARKAVVEAACAVIETLILLSVAMVIL